MSTEQDDGRRGQEQIGVDALFAAQQADRRRQRTRIALVTIGALAAGGVTGGIAVGAIGGDDGGSQPVAGDASSSADPSSGQDDAEDSSAEDSGDADSGDAEDSGGSSASGEDQSELPSEEPDAGSTPSLPDGSGSPGGIGGTTEGTGSSSSGQQPGGPAEAPSTPTSPEQSVRHVVQPGESLWQITAAALGSGATAQQVLDSWPRVYEANRQLIGDDPDRLYTGQELVIPALA